MPRLSALGEPVLQPGDNIAACFGTAHGTTEGEFTAWFVQHDPTFDSWACELRDQDDNVLCADGFSSRDQLEQWLAEQAVAVVD